MEKKSSLKLNEWISPNNRDYSYQLYWPYSEELDPDSETLDVHVKKNDSREEYWGTFVTLQEIQHLLLNYKKTGENKYGVYLSVIQELIVEELSRDTIEKTIEDLLEKRLFEEMFKKFED